MSDFDPKKTIENFLTMSDYFGGGFDANPQAVADLARAIRALQNDNRNLTERNALLRQRPDLPADRIPAHAEMARLQAVEKGLQMPVKFYGLEVSQVEAYRLRNQIPDVGWVRQALLGIACDAMESWQDERGVTWLRPTAYAYAMVCRALARAKNDASKNIFKNG